MVVVLAVIGMVSAGVLSVVYQNTSAIIEENAARALESSVLEVLPGTSTVNIVRLTPDVVERHEDQRTEKETEQTTSLIYQGVNDQGDVIGYAFVGEGNGYGGVVRVLVGVDETTDEILNIKVIEHSETPGLGSRVEEDTFRNRFVGKTVDDPIQINQDIDNLSGATMSARAVAEAVREGFKDTVAAYKGGK